MIVTQNLEAFNSEDPERHEVTPGVSIDIVENPEQTIDSAQILDENASAFDACEYVRRESHDDNAGLVGALDLYRDCHGSGTT